MTEKQPQDTRPKETVDGQLIVYVLKGIGGTLFDCPALGYSIGYSGSTVANDAGRKKGFEALIRRNSQVIVRRSEAGEQFPEGQLDYARRFADEETELPLKYMTWHMQPITTGF